MAPILMVVAWNMSERKHFASILREKSPDAVVLVVTFLLTVLTSLTTAVAAGLLLSFGLSLAIRLRAAERANVPPERPGEKLRKS
jgi:MFS superfamily sulfate permease-like transporter